MIKKLLWNALISQLVYAQLYFPDDGRLQTSSQMAKVEEIVSNVTFGERSSTVYEQYVDRVISHGILKLTLSVDKAMTSGPQIRTNSLVYAPVSIAGALALVMLGSSGKTFDEITTVMGWATGIDIHSKSQLVHEQFGCLFNRLQSTTASDFDVQLNMATGIFVQDQYPIRDIYKHISKSVYQSEVLNLDYENNSEAAQDFINKWVSDKTNNKIDKILEEPPSPASKVIIASVLYFKAPWEEPFFDGTTRRRPFFTNGRKNPSDRMVDMMSNGATLPYYRDRTLDCEIMGFPYKGNRTTMYVVIPNHSSAEKITNFENSLTPADIERLVEHTRYTEAVIMFPKMRLESTIDLRRPLQALGIQSLFIPGQANLALLSSGVDHREVVSNVPLADKYNRQSMKQLVPLPINTNANEEVLIFSKIKNPNDNTYATNQRARSPGTVVNLKNIYTSGRNVRESLDEIRQAINNEPSAQILENPGLYADQILHKVYMDITESGTEAAAATSVSLSRDGGRITFKADVPFLFFIWHEETKLILFWGSVKTPTPNYPSQQQN